MGTLRFRQVHLDFHTSERITAIGDAFDPDAFAQTLKQAAVNSITCFARCHHGMIYYDTKFPAKHPHLQRDLLREQIEACHRYDIRVPIYITVGWDEYTATKHPEWLERGEDGRPHGAGPLSAGWRKLCFNTPYIDYVEEQTCEVLDTFADDVDGLFFDIIQQNPCCCTYCLAAMESAGLDAAEAEVRQQFAAQVLVRFKQRMTAAVRKHNKACTIFYNAGHVGPDIRTTLDTYSHLELESLPSGGWGYDHFPITVRFAKNLGLEYLGMTGKFHKSWADFGGFKNQPALEYECFTALANGAKVSVGDQLHPSGAINQATYELIGRVFRQVREKEDWCNDVKPVSEIAVFSPEAQQKGTKRIHPSLGGVYRMLEEGHYQFDIIDGENDVSPYALLILPDEISIDDRLQEKINHYLGHGGRLLLSYQSGCDVQRQAFRLPQMGVSLVGEAVYSPDYLRASDALSQGLLPTEYVMYERGLAVTVTRAEVLAQTWNPYFNRRFDHFCSHNQTPVHEPSPYPAAVQSGPVIYFSHPIFRMYYNHGLYAYKRLVLNAVDRLLPQKRIQAEAPSTAHFHLNYQAKDDRYVLHVLHYIPERRSAAVDTIEDVIPLYHTKLQVRLPARPQRAYLAPQNEPLAFQWHDGCATIEIPEVIGHQMVVFQA